MKKLQKLIEYYVLIVFITLIKLLSLDQARFVARRLGDFVYYFLPVRKKVMLQNLTEAFKNEKSATEIEGIAHRTYKQFAQTMMEIIFLPKITAKDLQEMIFIEGLEILDEALKKGKGAVLVGSHFGNWELMAAALASKYPLTLVVGQQTNQKVDDLLNSYRLTKGVKIVSLKLALRGVLKALSKNEFIAIVADQDAHEDGAFVDFFGRPASTPKGPATFALKVGCPLIMGHLFRDGKKLRVKFENVAKPEPSGDLETDIINYTAGFTKILENYVRQYPDHWFWMHKRWKTKMPEI